jgi:type I restriction enzyme M protein
MSKKNYRLPEETACLEDCISLFEERGYLVLDKGNVKYTAFGKSYNFSDPKEKTRMMFYYDLIEKYKYPVDRIEFEISVPGGALNNFADIVIFTDDEERTPYIAIECRSADTSKTEFEQAELQAITNAKLLKADFAVCIAGEKCNVIEIDDSGFETKISDIPVCYGR